MIRPLRRTHRAATALLAVLLPLLLLGALAWRQPAPVQTAWPLDGQP